MVYITLGGINVVFTKYLVGYSLGYIVVSLIYFIFDWFSLTFILGSVMGIGLFALMLKGLFKKKVKLYFYTKSY